MTNDKYVLLWAQVLSQAVEDKKSGPSQEEIKELLKSNMKQYATAIRKDATEWLQSGDTGPGTFIWVCEQLNLDVQEVRGKCNLK